MKRVAIISLILIFGLCLATGAFAADKDAISKASLGIEATR